MILGVEFKESTQTIKCDFGEVHNVSDGGYERGYAAGYTACETEICENLLGGEW